MTSDWEKGSGSGLPIWFRSSAKRRLHAKNCRRRASRRTAPRQLLFERLEDRVVLTQLSVTSPLDPPGALIAGTLRYEINQANLDASAGTSDTIVFNTSQMGSQSIVLEQGLLELSAGSGLTTINGAGQVTISGNKGSLIFRVDQGAQVALTGLTLESGAGTVVNAGVNATIKGVSFPATYSLGGAIDNSGSLSINETTLENNAASGLYSYGGAIYNSGTVNINSSTLSGNQAADASGWGGGGAVYNTGSLNVINSLIVNNAVTTDPAVTGLAASPQAGGGGGIDNVGVLTVNSSTLVDNAAATGGGIDNTSTSALKLVNTIVAGNNAVMGPDVSGAAVGNNNLIGQNGGLTGITNRDSGHDLVGTSSNQLNPLLTPLGNYGGSVPTMALLSGSPAIAAAAASTSITTDERGLPRPTTPDIGAFQTQAVTSLIVSAPTDVIAGVAFPVTITASDQYGNIVTNYNGPATLTSSDGQRIFFSASAINLYNGTAAVTITLDAAGATTLKATSGKFAGASANMVVSPPVASFAVTVPTTATAGVGFAVTITAQDRFGNTVSDYNGFATLASSDGQTIYGLSGPINLMAGVATVSIILDTANKVTLAANLGSIQGTSSSLTVGAAAATSFSISAPRTAGVGAGFPVTLTAEDPFGNVVTNYSGSVTLNSSDGQSVALSPATLTWFNGISSATATLNQPDVVTLDASDGTASGISSNILVEPTTSQAISNGLAAFVSWGGSQSFPLVGTSTLIQNALQLGLVAPINAYFAANPAANTPTSPGFITLLEGLSAQLGDLTITVPPSSVQQTVNGSQIIFSLDFQASGTIATTLGSLGAQADQLGIHLANSSEVNVTTSLNFNFGFGVDQTAGLTAAQAFFLNAPAGGLSASVIINAANITSGMTIGFLGAQTTSGSIQMNASAANSSNIANLQIIGLQTLSLAPSGSVNISLPLQAQLGTQTASGTLTISAPNLAVSSAATVNFQNFSGWQNFSTVGPDAVLSMLNQFSSQLGQIGSQLWSTDLPFLGSLSLAQAANLEQTFQTEVTSQISSWSNMLQRTVADFSTAQGLANLLAQVLDVSPTAINVQFNATTNALTYTLNLTSYTFSSLLSQVLQVNLDQDGSGLANASNISGLLSLVPKITASLTFGINLTPIGNGFALTPSTQLSQLNGGAGVRINGTSAADLNITLSDGTSNAVSLNGDKTVQDVMNSIQNATGGKVKITIDSNDPAALDVSQPIATPIAMDFTTPPTANLAAHDDVGKPE